MREQQKIQMMISHFLLKTKTTQFQKRDSVTKDNQKQTLHLPSLTIGAIISVICITALYFLGLEGILEPSEPLIEKQFIEEPKKSQ